MKLLVVAGEISGDAHGGPLLRELRCRLPDLQVCGIGGPRMAAEGLESLYPLDALQLHGFAEILRHIPRQTRILREFRRNLTANPPDSLLCIDYPGFNLRLAAIAKGLGIPVIWYSSPQIWAWRKHRLRKLARLVDKMIVLLPFEEELYRKAGVDATFAGHPLVGVCATEQETNALREQLQPDPDIPVVGVMPGSRPSELRHNLPAVLGGISLIRQAGFRAQFVIPLAPTLDQTETERLIADSGEAVEIVPGAFLPLLQLAEFSIVASGTATLQVGLAGIPFIVVYRVSRVTYWLAKALAYVHHVTIANILAGHEIVPELLQDALNPEQVRDTFLALATDTVQQEMMRWELDQVAQSLGEPGAYGRGAQIIADFLQARITGHGTT